METDHLLLKRIAKTRRGRAYLYPLLGSIAVTGIFLIGLHHWASAMPRTTELEIGALGLLTALLTYRLVLRITRRNLHQTAEELDDDLDAHNQLEAMVELKDTRHPLRVPQEQRAEQELGQYKPAPWSLLLSIAALLLVVELSGYTQQLLHFGWGSIPKIDAPKIPPEAPKKDEFAELKLTKPEAEIRLKPMDEVAWEGNGRSSNGFDDLYLTVYLNGEPVANIPVENEDATGKPGEVSVTGSFFLDELNAEPYDVISYNLEAHSEINGEKAAKVVSIPQFIEVRPFREDAEVMSAGDEMEVEASDDSERAQMIRILGTIHRVLEFELILNKAVFAARTSGLADDDPVFLEQVGLLKQEQTQLKDKLDEFLTNVNPERLTPNMTVSLRAAKQFMEEAALQLEQLAPSQERTEAL